MNYVIQNFSPVYSSIRLNLRIRAAWLARNFYVVYTLIMSNYKGFVINPAMGFAAKTLFLLGHGAFRQLSKVLFSNTKRFKYIPIGSNFPVSAQRFAVSSITSLLTVNSSRPRLVLPVTSEAFTNPYFQGSHIAITPVANKPFAAAIFKFLRMSLATWFSWPRAFVLSTHYTHITQAWRLLKFLNKYFFKVYGI